MDVVTGTAVWYHGGFPVVPLRWVLVRDPVGRFDPQALLSTDLTLTAATIVGYFVRRWPVEVTFEEAQRQLGVETQHQWNDTAIARPPRCSSPSSPSSPCSPPASRRSSYDRSAIGP